MKVAMGEVPTKSVEPDSGEFLVHQMSTDQIIHYWPHITVQLNLVPRLWGRWTLDMMLERALVGGVQVWSVGTAAKIHMIVFTQIVVFPTEKTLQVFLIIGNRLKKALPILVATLMHYAKLQECASADVIGRAGWTRMLAKYGFKFRSVMLTVEVSKERVH